MNHKRTTISIVLATLMLVSLFAAVSSATGVSGTVKAGTGPALSSSDASTSPTGYLRTSFFAVDTDGALWHTNGSGTWDSLGGVCTSSPAAISWISSSFRLDVFVRGSDGAMWQRYYQNGWSGWIPLGGQLAPGTGPAVASWSAGRLDVFAEGTNGALWHKWWNGSKWSGWESLGGKLTASPAAVTEVGVSNAHNIYVFVRGTDGAVWQKSYNSGWSSWHSLGGQLAPGTGPAVSQDLWLFAQGTDHQLWRRGGEVAGAGWGLTATLPEALATASPAALLPQQDTMVCVIGTSGNVWWSGDSLGNWNYWTSVGSLP
jgi:hypothetical protein